MKRIAILSLLFIISVTVFGQYLRTDGTNVMTGELRIRKEAFSSIELESNTGAYIDFKHSQSADFNGRIIWNYNSSNRFDFYGNVNFRNEIYTPVLKISNELQIPSSFSGSDPSIGLNDNTGYGINIHSTSGIGFALNNSHRMVILPSGNVGIGTSIPNSKLEVGVSHVYNQDEEMRIGSYYQSKFIGVGLNYRIDDVGACTKHLVTYHGGERATIMTFNHDNKVGIGTTSPEEKLSVEGSTIISNSSWFKSKSTTGSKVRLLGIEGGNNVYVGGIDGAHTGDLYIRRGGYNRIKINSTGLSISAGNTNVANPTATLDVQGNIKAQEIEVTLMAANNITYTTNGQTADHVFESDYKLRELSEVESFINENKHLPDVPSATEMEEQGVNLAEMNKLLLQKVEELTLYAIEQEKVRREESEARRVVEERLTKIEALLIQNNQ